LLFGKPVDWGDEVIHAVEDLPAFSRTELLVKCPGAAPIRCNYFRVLFILCRKRFITQKAPDFLKGSLGQIGAELLFLHGTLRAGYALSRPVRTSLA